MPRTARHAATLAALGLAAVALPSPALAAKSLSASPSQLVSSDALGGGGAAPRTVTLTNTGTSALTITSVKVTGTPKAQFAVSGPAMGAALGPGQSTTASVTFTATATGPQLATLKVAFGTRSISVNLGGLGTKGSFGSKEPSLQWILDTYRLGVHVNPTGFPAKKPALPGTSAPIGDEVAAESFAAVGGPVRVTPLATFSLNGPAANPNVDTVGWYADGNPSLNQLFDVPNASNQMIDPAPHGPFTFNPPGTFGFWSSWHATTFHDHVATSRDAFNISWDATNPHKVRVFPVPGQANTYVVATEEFTGPFDFQDQVLLVSNVRPA
jgi:hypothetical protein